MSINIGSDLCSHFDTGKRTQRRPTRPQQKTPQYAASLLQKVGWRNDTVDGWTESLSLLIIVLVQIPSDRNLLSTHSCLKIVTGRLLSDVYCFSSEVSFCRSPGFHLSTMIVLWLLTCAEITVIVSLDMGEWKLNLNAHWPADPCHSHIYLWDWSSRHHLNPLQC